MESNLTAANYILRLQDGNVRPFIKSEPVPEVNTEPVKVVVGDSFEDMVSKSGKNGQFYYHSHIFFIIVYITFIPFVPQSHTTFIS